jgi:hypothetical protein
MGTFIERLANRKRVAPPEEAAPVVLPMAPKGHEGACGEGCGCEGGDHGGCCSP